MGGHTATCPRGRKEETSGKIGHRSRLGAQAQEGGEGESDWKGNSVSESSRADSSSEDSKRERAQRKRSLRKAYHMSPQY